MWLNLRPRRVHQRRKLGAEAGVFDLEGSAAVLEAGVFGVLGPLFGFGGPCTGSGEEIWVHTILPPSALYTHIHARAAKIVQICIRKYPT